MAYTIRFSQKDDKILEGMAIDEGTTKAELIRRAINFYNVKLKAVAENKKIYLETTDSTKELVMV